MKTSLIAIISCLAAVALVAADSSPKEDLAAAAKKLGDQANYGWTTTVVVPESAQFKPGPTEGKTEKDGFTYVTMSFGDNKTEIVTKGGKAAVTDQEGAWKLSSELENAEGPARFLSRIVKNMKTPAAQVADLLDAAKELKKDGDSYVAELTEEGAKKQFRFGQPKNAKGSVKFWIKDGLLSKFQVKLEGAIEFNGNEIDAARTTTTQIKGAGETKVDAPSEAKKKLS